MHETENTQPYTISSTYLGSQVEWILQNQSTISIAGGKTKNKKKKKGTTGHKQLGAMANLDFTEGDLSYVFSEF